VSEGRGRFRSLAVLGIGVLVAVGLGAGAALLRPGPPAAPPSPTNIGIPVPADYEPIDPRALHERLLEELILEARTAQWPERLPSFATFTLLYTSDPEAFDWVVERLAEPDVPDALALGWAAHLPTRRRDLDGAVERLLLPRLESGDVERARAALDVLRAGGRTALTTSIRCNCAFGLYPPAPTAGAPAWLLAFSLDRERALSWQPRPLDGEPTGWLLGLRDATGDAGAPVLIERIEAAPTPPWTLRPTDGDEAVLQVLQSPP
jgi:hypothetical protein